MARQRITEGAILEIAIEGGYYVYSQILLECLGYAFFDYRAYNQIKEVGILETKNILFILMVYDDVITSGHWKKVGKLRIREDLKIQPNKFIYHKGENPEYEIYNPNTGEIRRSTKEQVKGLECAAVWEANHVEDRIRDHYLGVPCIWMEGMTVE